MNKKPIQGNDSNLGFTIFEMAVVLIITGVLLAFSYLSYRYFSEYVLRRGVTENHLSLVQDALSTFAARNHRIPCPADPDRSATEPFGAERGSGADGSLIPNAAADCSGANATGILPFLALGLPMDNIVDGWGNFFTYKISPAFARNPEFNIATHRQCRSAAWIEAGRNLNPTKARFCCSGEDIAQDIVVCRDTGAGVGGCAAGDRIPPWPRDSVVSVYNSADIEDNSGEPDDRTSVPALVLISHGPDEHGAYNRNMTGTQIDNAATAGTFEEANADPSVGIVWDLPVNTQAGNNHYQDILLWMSQDEALAHLLGESCAGP